LGGNLKCEENVPFKASFPKYVATMSRRMELAGVKVILNTEVTPDFVREFEPDVLVIAIGAESFVPPVSGIDSKNVIPVTELHTREQEIGKRVAVLGGGLSGCECAVHLAKAGHEVTVIEMRSNVAVDANPRHRPALMRELKENVTMHTGLTASAINENGVKCTNKDGNELFISADTVLLAAGMRAHTDAVDALRGTAPNVQVIGDCDRPANIRSATFRAYHAGLDI
ncbi:MAG: FAD-dependent oxidoreductase, partial [Clostridia bacterium]|nr:FAD-dependent oxidoreductase [Clostridia bacterium]